MTRHINQRLAEWLLRRIGFVPILWHVDDVRDTAEQYELGFVPTKEECFQVLDHANENHNAEYGIGWDDLATELETLKGSQDASRPGEPGGNQ